MKTSVVIPQGLGKQVPPVRIFVFIYFSQKGLPQSEAERFLSHYEGRAWKNMEGNPILNWKTVACEWVWQAMHE